MSKDVIMPALGMAQETGTLLQWLKAPGATIVKGEPLMEVETDKATVEVEAPASGVLANVAAQPGDVVPVGQVIARIVSTEEAASPTPQASGAARAAASPLATRIASEHNVDLSQIKPRGDRIQKEDVLAYVEALTPHPGLAATPPPSPIRWERERGGEAGEGVRALASPKARRLAKERGLELTALAGSGPSGAVLAADVLAAALPPPSGRGAGGEGETLAVSRMWRVMVERVSQAWTTIPHFYLLREVNAARLIAWRDEAQKRSGEKITYTDLLVKLVAAALRQHPRLNAAWQNETIVLNRDINVGLAVAVDDGLIVPVIHHADQLGLSQLAARRAELVSKAQTGKLPLNDLSAGTFTISNLGMYGVDAFNAIVNPPQAAILAVSRIAERVVPLNGQPAVQPMLTLSLSCDHRVVDGARGAQFLQALADLIEEPMRLLD